MQWQRLTDGPGQRGSTRMRGERAWDAARVAGRWGQVHERERERGRVGCGDENRPGGLGRGERESGLQERKAAYALFLDYLLYFLF